MQNTGFYFGVLAMAAFFPNAGRSEIKLRTDQPLVEICVGDNGYTVPCSPYLQLAVPDDLRRFVSLDSNVCSSVSQL